MSGTTSSTSSASKVWVKKFPPARSDSPSGFFARAAGATFALGTVRVGCSTRVFLGVARTFGAGCLGASERVATRERPDRSAWTTGELPYRPETARTATTQPETRVAAMALRAELGAR